MYKYTFTDGAGNKLIGYGQNLEEVKERLKKVSLRETLYLVEVEELLPVA